ncbi:hypothetical protein ACOSQ3_017392 [Xanthoceras sorbifolium]
MKLHYSCSYTICNMFNSTRNAILLYLGSSQKCSSYHSYCPNLCSRFKVLSVVAGRTTKDLQTQKMSKIRPRTSSI